MLPSALRSRAAIPVAAVTAAALCTAVVLMGGDGDAAPAPGAAPSGTVTSGTGSSHLDPARPLPASLGADLVKRDPKASANARAVYQMLADLESQARGGHPKGTVIGHHVEAQNELYNLNYGDYQGVKGVGYYYKKAADITGKLPGFVETDLGPGYGQGDWGVGNPRSYSKNKWPTCSSKWQYTDDAVDLLTAVWSGHPRPDDGTYGASGVQQNCDGSTTSLPDNGGGPAGLVGMSFHEPYPGSPVKSFDRVLCANSPAATDSGWFGRVVDDSADTVEHRQLLTDLSYLADHLQYLADHDVPVLFRPYHEMNNADCRHSFWWSGQRGADYQKLWRITYDYLVRTRGLHNLIFVWSPVSWDGAPGADPWNYYPGAQYVDVVGVDDYSGSPRDPIGTGEVWTKRYYDGLAAYRKPRILAESFAVPVNARQKETLIRTPWTLWTVWGQALTEKNLIPDQVVNSPSDIKATYNSKQAITGGYGHFGADFDWSSLHIQ